MHRAREGIAPPGRMIPPTYASRRARARDRARRWSRETAFKVIEQGFLHPAGHFRPACLDGVGTGRRFRFLRGVIHAASVLYRRPGFDRRGPFSIRADPACRCPSHGRHHEAHLDDPDGGRSSLRRVGSHHAPMGGIGPR